MQGLTRQRSAVFSAFSDTGRVLTAPEILAHAREIVPEISLSTVYRQVSLLLADGEIAKVELPGEPERYEVACKGDGHAQHDGHEADHHHHYFHCSNLRAGVSAARLPGADERPGAQGLPGQEPRGDAARLVRVVRRRGPQKSRTQGALTSTPAAVGCRPVCRFIENEFAITYGRGSERVGRRTRTSAERALRHAGEAGNVSRVGKTPPNVPEHVANLFAAYRPDGSRFAYFASLNRTGHMYTDTANQIRIDGFTTLDAAVSYRLQNTLLTFRMRNLTDKLCATWAGRATSQVLLAPRRTFELSARFDFGGRVSPR